MAQAAPPHAGEQAEPRPGKVTNRTLHQEMRATGEARTVEIYNTKYVKIMSRGVGGVRKYHLNLAMMEPWPVRHRSIAWRWLLATLYCALGALAYGSYLYANPGMEQASRVLPFLMVFTLGALGSLFMFFLRSPNVTEFRSRYGGVPLISLLYNKPSAAEFRSLVAELRTRILAASQQLAVDKRRMLAIELEELRRLRDEGALHRAAYDKAKARILKLHENKT